MKKLISTSFFLFIIALQTGSAQGSSDNFRPLINNYLILKNALTNDAADSARSAALALLKSIDGIVVEKLDQSCQKAWVKAVKELRFEAEHISESTAIDHQREHFKGLSETIAVLVRTTAINEQTLYYDYCPMAAKGKGAYWLSEQSVIKNPYMGKRMLSCGSNKEILKPTEK